MVAKIIIGKKLRGALQYNENKVLEGQADLLLASGFAGDVDQMNFHQRLQRFENLMMLKPSVKTNTLHISLNFDAVEKMDDATLQRIAIAYMDKIGFGDQPYLAYRHHDAAHDHVHLVTTNIQANGEAINLHNIGLLKSKKAREEIEVEFNLVKAKGKQYKPDPAIKPVNLEKALYGKTPTKRAISNTVNGVISSYKYASIAELNAILKQFNVIAERGAEDTAMFQKKGLVYSLLNEHGNKVGISIKSSSLYTKPTLTYLEKQFIQHKENRQEFKPALKTRIDTVLNTGKYNEQTFTEALKKQGIAVLFRRSDGGQIYGITFVDHQSKTVFNGSDLGKRYTAKTLTDQFKQGYPLLMAKSNPQQRTDNNRLSNNYKQDQIKFSANPLEALLKPTQENGSFLPKRKRRKKKKISI
ncbi:MAG: relaxase/mobilization nuclease domain-containing protein [Mucilaginibacter sp.]|uniref:relaxase/mobilization nuclease domain-containing protein n=1 Tax=Mucilaginibacter sp. TaxID=1882438 RepID=UPI0032646E2C